MSTIKVLLSDKERTEEFTEHEEVPVWDAEEPDAEPVRMRVLAVDQDKGEITLEYVD